MHIHVKQNIDKNHFNSFAKYFSYGIMFMFELTVKGQCGCMYVVPR